MGRSCSYGVHLRACFPSAPSSYTSSHSLVSLSRLASCFFLRFSLSSCRTRRLKLCAAPSRSPTRFIHTEGEQASSTSTHPASRLRQLRAMKKPSSLGTEVEAGKEVHTSSLEEVSAVGLTSRKRATKRKKPVDELPLQQTSVNGVASSEVEVTPKKTSRRKKTDMPMLDSSVMDAPAAEERSLPAKSRQRKNRNTLADVEGEGELSSCKLEGSIESTDPNDLASSSTSSLSLGSPKKSTRKKKALTSPLHAEEIIESVVGTTVDSPVRKTRKKKASSSSLPVEEIASSAIYSTDKTVLTEKSSDALDKDGAAVVSSVRKARKKKVSSSSPPVEEIANSATEMIEENKALKEKSSDAIDVDGITMDTAKKKARKKVVSSSSSLEEISAGMEVDTMCEKHTAASMPPSSEPLKQDETAKPSGRRKQYTRRKTAVKDFVIESSVSQNTASHTENFVLGSGPTAPLITVGEKDSSSRVTQKASKVEDGATQMTVRSASLKSVMLDSVQKRRNEVKETMPSPGSESSANIGLEKFIAKGASNVLNTFSEDSKVESTFEPCVPQEVRKVENSVDKASLTDEMPVISFADSHSAYRRNQSEASSWKNDFNRKIAANVQQDLANLSVATAKASPQTSSLLEDALDSVKRLARQNTTEDQNKQREASSDKIARTKDIGYDWTGPRTSHHRKEGFSSHTSRMDAIRDPSGVQKQVTAGRTPTRSEGIYGLNVIPATSERQESNSQHWSRWSKSSAVGVAEDAVQRHEASYRKQFAMTDRRQTRSQQGYTLANVDRARGLDRKKRKEFSVRNIVANQASTISYMQIFGTGFDTGDTVPTVLLFFDRRRFIFNVGEGLHRFCMEHKFKLSKIDHVFLTRVCSETVGGLPGLILTLAAMNEEGFTVKTWGPSSLDDLAQAMRVFVPSGWMEHTHAFGPGANDHAASKSSSSPPVLLLEDELIKISAVLLYSEDTSCSKYDLVSSAYQMNLSTVYICELSTVRGKFDPDKARAKGLRPGFKYGKLQKGESVLSDDGKTMVHPEDVLGPSSPGPIMLLVDCPSMSYVSSLTSSTSLQPFFSEAGKVVNCMIHIGPTSVTSSKDYQSWMENFKETHHIMAQPEVKVLGMPTLTSWRKTLWKLNLVCPWLFPVVEIDTQEKKEAASGQMVPGDNMLKYRLRPLLDLGVDTSEVPKVFDPAVVQEKLDKSSPEILKARDMACQVWKRWSEEKSAKSRWKDRGNRNSQSLPACLHEVSREEMELVFLGTGSSQPSKDRNVTGIYIHLFKKGGLMLDCGEGTFAQLKRRYGAKGADDVVLGLKCIWISHLHADHFTGILRILSARRDLLQAESTCEPILVIGPKKLKYFLDSYGKVEDLGMEFLDCSQTTLEVQRWADGENAHKEGLINGYTRGASEKRGMQHIWKQPGYHIRQGIDIERRKRLRTVLDLLGLKDLYSVPVIHCPDAFAVVLEAQERKVSENITKPGWKLVYSGDTRPCQALVDAARNATILIHEATFEDDLIADAVKKNHSITHEAMKVGVDAEVYRIFLTHFSQRYPTIPYYDNQFKDRACLAFDMMSVNLADLPIVPELLPALQMLFRNHSDAEEEEAEDANALSV
ncbi:hypothetical protein GOP47_0030197 [Adiantum capillus-veneris]|nr:hypothetical protein GOP47_0030197 [Adiantum capillus-veneris]